jgi:hypothetical protein
MAVLRQVVGMIMFFLLAFASPVNSTEVTVVTLDGVWWQTLGYSEKLAAVQGMSIGYDAAIEAAHVAFFETLTPSPKEPDRVYHKLQAQETAFADRTFETMIRQIDAVFDRHPRLAKSLVSDFLLCSHTNGGNCEAVAAWDERLLKPAGHGGLFVPLDIRGSNPPPPTN